MNSDEGIRCPRCESGWTLTESLQLSQCQACSGTGRLSPEDWRRERILRAIDRIALRILIDLEHEHATADPGVTPRSLQAGNYLEARDEAQQAIRTMPSGAVTLVVDRLVDEPPQLMTRHAIEITLDSIGALPRAQAALATLLRS
jgi:hypothetical protein